MPGLGCHWAGQGRACRRVGADARYSSKVRLVPWPSRALLCCAVGGADARQVQHQGGRERAAVQRAGARQAPPATGEEAGADDVGGRGLASIIGWKQHGSFRRKRACALMGLAAPGGCCGRRGKERVWNWARSYELFECQVDRCESHLQQRCLGSGCLSKPSISSAGWPYVYVQNCARRW